MDNHERVAVTGNCQMVECPTCGTPMKNMGGCFGMFEFVCYGPYCDVEKKELDRKNE